MSEELKACPFCGSSEIRKVDSDAHLLCLSCGVEIIFDFRYLEDVNLNTRPLEDTLRKQLENLLNVCNQLIPFIHDNSNADGETEYQKAVANFESEIEQIEKGANNGNG